MILSILGSRLRDSAWFEKLKLRIYVCGEISQTRMLRKKGRKVERGRPCQSQSMCFVRYYQESKLRITSCTTFLLFVRQAFFHSFYGVS